MAMQKAFAACVNAATCGRSLINGLDGTVRSLQLDHLIFAALFLYHISARRNKTRAESENQFALAKAALQCSCWMENQKLLFRTRRERQRADRRRFCCVYMAAVRANIDTMYTNQQQLDSTAAAATADAVAQHKYNQSPFYIFGVFPFISARSFTQRSLGGISFASIAKHKT